MIELIDINKIHPHPYNPRKDLGDLSELAESIKQRGILQNLTVVPWYSSITGVGCDDPKQQEEMGYIAVIGHRRLAAAKLAGLEEIPCSISDMDQNTQIATMLLENIQRSDLTIWEQAQGLQMMLDLGENVGTISEKTGFSESTVRRRVKLLELDKDKFKAAAERGATLMDYAELDKIENINIRNKVLEKIGTPNFNYELKSALDKEKNDKAIAILIEQLSSFAEETKDTNGMKYIKAFYGSIDKKIDRPEDTDTVKYFFTVSNYGSVTLYKESMEEIKYTSVNKELEENRKLKLSKLEEITKRAYDLRRDFIGSITNTKAKKNISTIIEYSILAMVDGSRSADYQDIIEVLGIKGYEEDDIEFNKIVDIIRQQPELFLLLETYYSLDSNWIKYYNYRLEYEEDEDLNHIYALLEKLGYQSSDEELALRNGTHELFKCNDGKENLND